MTLELPLVPQSPWDFINVLAPVIKYYVALLLLFMGARWFNRQLGNDVEVPERQPLRPVLTPELTVESSEEEEEEEKKEKEKEEIKELVTSGNRLVPMDSQKPKQQQRKQKNAAKALFDGLRKVEQELKDKKAQDEQAQDEVSWNELHMTMLRRYQDKYPDHGPRVANETTDKYDDEFHALLRENDIDLKGLKRESVQGSEQTED
uniref:Uncharacterized protein n=1 Tax=Hyaloperonospora arabidopsidis (strain Emoy2) TaxID=559515 RepID=M4BLH9_HYAAE